MTALPKVGRYIQAIEGEQCSELSICHAANVLSPCWAVHLMRGWEFCRVEQRGRSDGKGYTAHKSSHMQGAS
jgi:hypothetical protein